MALDRKTSVGVGLATMGIVWAVYNQACPSIVDGRTASPNDRDYSGAEKAARWVSSFLVVGISLLTMDGTVFIMGGSAVIAESWLHRHANMVSPGTAQMVMPSSRQTLHAADTDPSAGYTPSA